MNKFRLPDRVLNNKHKPIDIGNVIIDYMAEDSENKIESQFWEGLDGELENKDLQELLYRSDFINERMCYGQDLSKEGEIAIALIMIDGKWMINFFNVQTYTSIKTNVLELIADSGRNVNSNGQKIRLFYRWWIDENPKSETFGRVLRTSFYNSTYPSKGIVEETEERYVYPSYVKFVPVKILRNNSKNMPDAYKVMGILQEINVLSNDIGKEWENIKTSWNVNGLFGNGKQIGDMQKDLENGERFFGTNNPNSKFSQQMSAIISGSPSASILLSNIIFLEDRTFKYSFQGRDMGGDGTNKHNMQVGMFNQAHSEYLEKKIKIRQQDYMRFFKDVVEEITGITAPKEIKIESSAYEQGKRDAMKLAEAQRENFKAQSEAQFKVADKYKIDAEVARKLNKIPENFLEDKDHKD